MDTPHTSVSHFFYPFNLLGLDVREMIGCPIIIALKKVKIKNIKRIKINLITIMK